MARYIECTTEALRGSDKDRHRYDIDKINYNKDGGKHMIFNVNIKNQEVCNELMECVKKFDVSPEFLIILSLQATLSNTKVAYTEEVIGQYFAKIGAMEEEGGEI